MTRLAVTSKAVTHLRASILASLSILASATFGFAQSEYCGGLKVAFESQDTSLADRACRVLENTEPLFRRCDLVPEAQPVIKLILGDDGSELPCLAAFHCEENLIRIVPPERFKSLLDPDSAFRVIEPLELFDSLVVHEVAHALVSLKREGLAGSLVGEEYIAYALQLESLGAANQTNLIEATSPTAIPRREGLREKVLMFSPDDFAVNAWQHFLQPENGCGFIHRIMDGDVNFNTR